MHGPVPRSYAFDLPRKVSAAVGWLIGWGFDLPCNVCLQVRQCALSAPLLLSQTVPNVLLCTVLYCTVLLLSLQVRRLGLKCALSAKANEGRLILLDSLAPTGRPKTSIMAGGCIVCGPGFEG